MASHLVIARPYARAAFEVAYENEAISTWAQFLEAGCLITEDEKIGLLLRDPKVSSEMLFDIYQSIAKRYIKEPQERFLKALVENKRLNLFPEIALLFHEFRAESEKTVVAQIISYHELSEQHQQAMKQSLKKRLKREIRLQCQLDQSILGGAIIRAGDIVIDGSVRRRVEQLREESIR